MTVSILTLDKLKQVSDTHNHVKSFNQLSVVMNMMRGEGHL